MTVFFQAFEEKLRSLQQEMFNPQFTNGIVLLPVDIMRMMLMLTCDRVQLPVIALSDFQCSK